MHHRIAYEKNDIEDLRKIVERREEKDESSSDEYSLFANYALSRAFVENNYILVKE